jgi:hypothetical protein
VLTAIFDGKSKENQRFHMVISKNGKLSGIPVIKWGNSCSRKRFDKKIIMLKRAIKKCGYKSMYCLPL